MSSQVNIDSVNIETVEITGELGSGYAATGGRVEVDDTLTKSGAAADAKVTGEKIKAAQSTANEAKTAAGAAQSAAEAAQESAENTLNTSLHKIDNVSFPVGANLVSSATAVTLGANWSGSISEGFTHAAGSAEPLMLQVATEEGTAYYINWETPESYKAALFVRIGDTPNVDVYRGSTPPSAAIVSDGGNLIFTPESAYAGTIKNVSIRKIGEGETIITKEAMNHDVDTMQDNLDGFWNVALGRRALQSNVNGSRNIAIGNEALRTFTSGTRNVGVGTFAMCYLKYGDRNIAIGADSLWFATHATDCIAIGMAAMSTEGTGETDLRRCIAIGRGAMQHCNDKAAQVVAIGQDAGAYAYRNDVFVGDRAGYKSGGWGNTAIGYAAFSSIPESGKLSGNYNTFVGIYADVADTKTSKYRSTAVGYNAKVEKSDQVVLGGDDVKETLAKGDLVVRGTDGVKRRILFNPGEKVPVGDAQLFDYTTAETSTQIPNMSTLKTNGNGNSRTWIVPYDGKSGDKISFNVFCSSTSAQLGSVIYYIYLTNDKPDAQDVAWLQNGVTNSTTMCGVVEAQQDFEYIAVSAQLSSANEDAWNEIEKGLVVQKGDYSSSYTNYYQQEAGTVTWEVAE